ncbi:MAG: hypothetical protein LUE31_03035 [Lachnospiraceae bacterium]|nr:hypothetical protein [Lachnospiraceae bacterium]
MSFSITGTTISMTRGDTMKVYVAITDTNGSDYVPDDGDVLRFAAKKDYADDEPLILKDIPIDSLLLTLEPADTKELDYGSYVYDIELTTSEGEVSTVVPKGKLVITEEVY